METHMRKLLLAIVLCLFALPALAQSVTCPTRPVGDSSNACASTAFVQNNSAPIIPVAGAVCDGVFDNAAAINAAITQANAVKGIIQLPSGVCLIKNQIFRSNVSFSIR